MSETFPPQAVWQHTLREPVVCVGVGLHTGIDVQMTMRPMPEGHGIQFLRSDFKAGNNRIHLGPNQVSDTRRGTKIANDDACEISTVEHLLATLIAFSVDNVLVEINGPEIPAMDGSAAAFVNLFQKTGVIRQNHRRRYIRILREVSVTIGNSTARFVPHDGFSIDVGIRYENQVIGEQFCQFDVNAHTFANEIASARTFVLDSEITGLKAAGHSKGGTLENCLVVHENRIENKDGLRYPNEFARHKAMDALGDLALAGAPLLGHYEAKEGGHQLNHLALKALMDDPSAWVFDELSTKDENSKIHAKR